VQSLLDDDRAIDGLDGAGEIGDHAVAGGAGDIAAVACDMFIHDGTMCGKRGEGPLLIFMHMAAVAFSIGDQDCGKLALDCGRLCRRRHGPDAIFPRAQMR